VPDFAEQFSSLLCRPLSQHGDAFHKKLIEVGSENRQKFRPFQQRVPIVNGFREYAVIEVQPTQVAIDPDIRKRLRYLAVENPSNTD
jgi:hypothetical protein